MTIHERNTKKRLNRARYIELKEMLEARRLEIIGEVQHKMRDARLEHAASVTPDVRDEAESSEADIQGDIEFAVLQMKTETLHRITEAIDRLDEGTFGYCYECGAEIATARLRALPFAVRCTECEAEREMAIEREQMYDARRSPASLFADFQG